MGTTVIDTSGKAQLNTIGLTHIGLFSYLAVIVWWPNSILLVLPLPIMLGAKALVRDKQQSLKQALHAQDILSLICWLTLVVIPTYDCGLSSSACFLLFRSVVILYCRLKAMVMISMLTLKVALSVNTYFFNWFKSAFASQ